MLRPAGFGSLSSHFLSFFCGHRGPVSPLIFPPFRPIADITGDISDEVGWGCLSWASPLKDSVPVERGAIWTAACFTSLLIRFGIATVCHG